MSNVKLAIRVRPYTEKELRSEKDRVPVVSVVDDKTVTITNIKVSVSGAGDSRERTRRYHADYTFDSSCLITQPCFASQEKVFEAIGREVISSVSRGCSACVLAYGQSATGKTHTMMGTETQPGLIPRLCKALYELQPFDFTISFLEIYNERVHDLLTGDAPLPTCHSLPRRRGNARKDLRVREHPSKGPYVQNLRRVAVQNAEALLTLVGEGARRRRTAATRRNSTSSRSHALLEIATPHATLHLADLAGSEKASWEGCGGGRQKEGANINKSLVALSNVISALVSGGPGRGRFVPYRDSALTWLLKDCFTGGASTFIIATVSPSVACYGESASTLRWAAQARQLPTPRIVNCGTHVASRAALQAQLNQLITELSRNYIQYIPETGKITFDEEHWTLRAVENISQSDDLNKTTNIGNIMNITRPKTDANNSESTASSVASGSSDVINTMDKNLKLTNEINKEMDKLFGPALERTNSGDNLKVVAPLRHKRRQCRSQEVLPIDETSVTEINNLTSTMPSQSEAQITEVPTSEKIKAPHITILHENQRAEIVASVTERLYSKLKKKEEAAVSKVESIVDRKIMEPLSELKICTNARQRLVDLSQKALRNKRRIGIPAHTQTRLTVTRVRDQAIDVQTDLYSYITKGRRSQTFFRDVATETVPMTPRCKEIAVGPTGSLKFSDRCTETKRLVYKNSFMMTDIASKNNCCTQTQVVAPPRRKKRETSLSKDVCSNKDRSEECFVAPVISINISQMYPVDSESQSSDDNSENLNMINSRSSVVTTTPDLLTNHSAVDSQSIIETAEDEISVLVNVLDDSKPSLLVQDDTIVKPMKSNTNNHIEEFPDTDDLTLPRVSPSSARKANSSEIKNLILGRSENIYPYNIILSPPRERDTKRIVKFKDIEAGQAIVMAPETNPEIKEFDNREEAVNKNETASDVTASDKDLPVDNDYESIFSDSTESSKLDTDSFIWKKGSSRAMGSLKRNYVPVYKSSKYKTAKARTSNEFLNLKLEDNEKSYLNCDSSLENLKDVSSSDSQETDYAIEHERKQHKRYFDGHFYNSHDYNQDEMKKIQNIERHIFDSCNNLEESVNKYKDYITNYKDNMKVIQLQVNGGTATNRRPKEYLQHLVQLRREVVKAESENTDSSIDVSHN